MWEKQLERLNAIDKLIKTILAHNDFYENKDLRIFPKKQKELWEEGFDEEQNKYVGAKWGKYLRAPEIFFKILEKGKGKLIPLKEVAEVRRGFTTGANEFFYLTKKEIKRWGIEREFLEPVIFSLKEIEKYYVDKSRLKYKVLICDKEKNELEGTNVLKYIEWGERKGFHKRPTCASRKPWYSLAKNRKYASLIFPEKVGERMPIFYSNNTYEDKKLYGILPKDNKDCDIIFSILNSTLTRMFIEFTCRQLTGAQAIADIDVIVVEKLLIPNPNKLSVSIKQKLRKLAEKLRNTKSESIFKEIGNSIEEIDISKIKPERYELDKIIMGEILGLTEEEQLEVYKAVIDLVKSRIEKAKSVKRNKK